MRLCVSPSSPLGRSPGPRSPIPRSRPPLQHAQGREPLRADRSAVPANAQIDIQSCGGDWCYGSWRGLYGFLPSFAVAQGGPPPGVAPPPPPLVFAPPPPPVVVTTPLVVGPVWGGPYVGGAWGYGWRRW